MIPVASAENNEAKEGFLPTKARKDLRDKRGRMEPQDNIILNSKKYEKMHETLQTKQGAVPSKWFKAAADVTSMWGVGSADFVNGPILTDADDAVLRYVHHKLAPENFAVYEQLKNGEIPKDLKGLSGKDLDYALVEREQALVQNHLDAYFAEKPDLDRAQIMESISQANAAKSAVSEALNIYRFLREMMPAKMRSPEETLISQNKKIERL